MSKTEKLIILGPSGSGKAFLMNEIIKKGLKPCLKWTTRPIRKGEKNGLTYNYVSEDFFIESIKKDKFISYEKFDVTTDSKEKSWYYGITRNDFKESQAFIMTPSQYKSLDFRKDERTGCFVVYLDIDRKIRESRLHEKSKNDLKLKLDADEIDFKGFDDYDLKVTDPDFSADDIYDLMD